MSNGQTNYTEATVSIFFDPDHVDCQHCPLMTTYSRNQCMRTGELIVDTRGRGRWCQLVFKDKEDE